MHADNIKVPLVAVLKVDVHSDQPVHDTAARFKYFPAPRTEANLTAMLHVWEPIKLVTLGTFFFLSGFLDLEI